MRSKLQSGVDTAVNAQFLSALSISKLAETAINVTEAAKPTMATLPTEIITDILTRFPVKTLLRFTSVCKSWNSLIKTPDFIKLHLKRALISNSDVHLILAWYTIFWSQLDFRHNQLSCSELDHPLKPNKLQIIGSCNGVVCICDSSKKDVFLFNPLTKSYRKLPNIHIPNPDDVIVVLGFGYDSKTDDYKVLRLVQDNPEKMNFSLYDEAKVYSLKNNSWKSVGGISYRILLWNHPGICVNEALHHVVIPEQFNLEKKMIVSFDLRNETYFTIDFPNYDDNSTNYLIMSELGGCLCLFVNYCTYGFSGIKFHGGADLWVMKDYGRKESWVKLFSISMPESIGINGEINVIYSKDETRFLLKVDLCSVHSCESELGWYDLETKKWEKISANKIPNPLFVAGFFMGTLVSVADDKLLTGVGSGTMLQKKKKRNDLNNFLSVGFKLRL